MGAGNVKAVYGLWGDLPDGAFRLLVYMATITMDDAEPRYYGGRETLAYAMGWVVADRRTTDLDEIDRRERAFKSVHRLVCVLKKAGAIKQIVAAAPGRNAEYALNLKVERSLKTWDRSRPRSPKKGDHSEPPASPADALATGNGPQKVGAMVPKDLAEQSQVNRRMVPNNLGPKEKEDQERTKDKEEKIDHATTSHPPRARAPEQQPQNGKVVELWEGVTGEAPYARVFPGRRWSTRGADAVAEASARRAKAVAEHQARLASGETS